MTADDRTLAAARARSRAAVVLLLVAAFVLRLVFGLLSEFWADDELQIYLIGLKFYATGQWPLFGPDVVYTQTQIPGGLQGLLVGGPLWLMARPESPYVLLNLLSLAALGLLGWYIGRRVPSVPRWFLWTWIFFSPWTLDVSTHVINTSYVLVGAVLFFVSAFEVVPASRVDAVPKPVAFFGLGFGTLWVYQEHLSAALLAPIAVVVMVLAARENRRTTFQGLAWFAAGALTCAVTVIPTVIAAGPAVVASRTGANIVFQPAHLLRLPQVAAQFFSLGSFELPRFIAANTTDRLAFLVRFPWAAPFVVVATLAGLAQAVVLTVGLFVRPTGESRQGHAVRRATLALFVLVLVSFALSIKAPASHVIYVAMPAVTIYAFEWWAVLLRSRVMRVAAMVLMSAGCIAHVAIAMRNFTDRSLYINRPLVLRAIQEKNHHLLGERRSDVWEGTTH